MPGPTDVDIVLYGASGYTGRLIAAELDVRGASFAVAGRDPERLRALSASLPSRPEVLPVRLDDAEGLERLARRARVVLSAAGPFVTMGAPLLKAALAAGAHFGDITGEQRWFRDAWGQREAARGAGVTIVNGLGFDVVPSDFAAAVACRGIERAERLDIGIMPGGGGLSGGTRRSMAASSGQGWWYDDGVYRSGPPGRFVRAFDFPAPLGRRTAAFIPWGDCATAWRSTGARRVRTFFTFPPKKARMMHWSWPVTAATWGLAPVRRRFEAKTARVKDGPEPGQRARSRFAVLAEATASDGRVQRALATGRDGYGFTGASAAHGAIMLAQGRVKEHGVLTPSQAFDIDEHCRATKAFELDVRRL